MIRPNGAVLVVVYLNHSRSVDDTTPLFTDITRTNEGKIRFHFVGELLGDTHHDCDQRFFDAMLGLAQAFYAP